MFDLIFMERGGILHTKRKRLHVMLSGYAARSRIGWKKGVKVVKEWTTECTVAVETLKKSDHEVPYLAPI
jgi:hypothetical protein